MTVVWEEEEDLLYDADLNYVDALDIPPCPRCGSSTYEKDRECHAFICDACGLWVDDDDDIG
jgi:hypothetical protein